MLCQQPLLEEKRKINEQGNKKEKATFFKKEENSTKRLIAGMRKSEEEGEVLDWNEEKDREETEQDAGGNWCQQVIAFFNGAQKDRQIGIF